MKDVKDEDHNEHGNSVSLSARLKEAREYCGFTQEEAAAHLDVPRTAISLMENGARRVGALELQRLAKLYQTTMGETHRPRSRDSGAGLGTAGGTGDRRVVGERPGGGPAFRPVPAIEEVG